jgi:hypothetical protein
MGLKIVERENPQEQRWTEGCVTFYNSRTGMASVQLNDDNQDQTATLFAGAFFSGVQSRLPRKGDHVRLQVRSVPEGLIALVARLNNT